MSSDNPTTAAPRPTLLAALRAAFAAWWGSGPPQLRTASANELAEDRTDMAVTRTLMASDRTLMAWIRTSLSLDSFGFTIYKVLHAITESGSSLPHGSSPRAVGLFLTGLGTLAVLLGLVEYAQALRDLRAFKDVRLVRPSFVIALLMSILGLFLFFSIFAKAA